MNANATITKTIETYGAGSIFERTVIRFRAGTRAAEIWLPISGRVTAYDRVTRSVVNCRRIPGWGMVDPLTLPFIERPSVRRKLRARGYASDETPF